MNIFYVIAESFERMSHERGIRSDFRRIFLGIKPDGRIYQCLHEINKEPVVTKGNTK